MNKGESIIRGYVDEVINQKKLERVGQYFAENCVLRTTDGREAQGQQAFSQALQGVFTAFPDLSVKINELVIAGNQVAYRITATGTHQGEFESIMPTQPPKSFRMDEAFFVKLEADKIVEAWILMDKHALLGQLSTN